MKTVSFIKKIATEKHHLLKNINGNVFTLITYYGMPFNAEILKYLSNLRKINLSPFYYGKVS